LGIIAGLELVQLFCKGLPLEMALLLQLVLWLQKMFLRMKYGVAFRLS
jgi:hypothetical protein